MSEFRVGAQARARQMQNDGMRGSPVGGGVTINVPSSSRGEDVVGPSGLGVIGTLGLFGVENVRTSPYTLQTAVAAMERKVLEILDEKDPEPNPNLREQINAGPVHPIGSDAHIEAARNNDGAWLPLPQKLSTLHGWGLGSSRHNTGVNGLAEALVDLNTEIDAYIRENDLTDDQIKNLLRTITSPRDNALFGDGNDFEEDVIRSKPGSETFGAFYTILLNTPASNNGYRGEIRRSMRTLFNREGTANIARTLVDGGIKVLQEEADRMGLSRHTDPDERDQEISLAVLNLISEVGKDSFRWSAAEREQWSQFAAEVRNAALNHPQEALAALRERYGSNT